MHSPCRPDIYIAQNRACVGTVEAAGRAAVAVENVNVEAAGRDSTDASDWINLRLFIPIT